MGSFAMWRLRQQDERVEAGIDTITNEFGLHQLWAGQYRDEIASKVAHVLKGGFTGVNYDESGSALARVYLRDNGFHFLDQERDPFKPSETYLRQAICVQCIRLSVSVGDLEVAKAIEYVWGDDTLS